MSTSRITGSVFLLSLCAALLYTIVAAAMELQFADVVHYAPALMRGFGLTLIISFTTFFAGFLIALTLTTLCSAGGGRCGTWLSVYCNIFRFTPLLAQLYLFYYGSGELSGLLQHYGLWWIFKSPLSSVFIVFTLNTAAYQTAILAGTLQTVSKEDQEACFALGMTRTKAYLRILLPISLRIAFRPLGNEFTKMIKASSIASVVTVLDLLGTTKLIYSETFKLEYYLVAVILYVCLVELSRQVIERLTHSVDPTQWKDKQRSGAISLLF